MHLLDLNKLGDLLEAKSENKTESLSLLFEHEKLQIFELNCQKIEFSSSPFHILHTQNQISEIFNKSNLSIETPNNEHSKKVNLDTFSTILQGEQTKAPQSCPVLSEIHQRFSSFMQKICSQEDLLILFENVFHPEETVLQSQEMSCLKFENELVPEQDRIFSATIFLTSLGKILIIPSDFDPYYFLDHNGDVQRRKSSFKDFTLKSSKQLVESMTTGIDKNLIRVASYEVGLERKQATNPEESNLTSEDLPEEKSFKVFMVDTQIQNPTQMFCLKDIFISDRQSLYKISLDHFNDFILKHITWVNNPFYQIHKNPFNPRAPANPKKSAIKNDLKSPQIAQHVPLSEDLLMRLASDDECIFLQLLKFPSRFSKSLLLHEPVCEMHSIRLLKPHPSFRDSAYYYFLNSLKLVECRDRSFKLVYLDKLLILLDNLAYGQQLLDVFFDSQLNLFFLLFCGGQSKCFRFEIQNIHQILFSEADYLSSFPSKEETHLALLNSIQVNIHFLHSTDFSPEHAFPLKSAQQDYLQGFNLFNSFDFLKSNNVVRASDFNDYLIYHAMFFYNNYSSSFVDLDLLHKNSQYLLKDFFNVFSPPPIEEAPSSGEQLDTLINSKLFYLSTTHHSKFYQNVSKGDFGKFNQAFDKSPNSPCCLYYLCSFRNEFH